MSRRLYGVPKPDDRLASPLSWPCGQAVVQRAAADAEVGCGSGLVAGVTRQGGHDLLALDLAQGLGGGLAFDVCRRVGADPARADGGGYGPSSNGGLFMKHTKTTKIKRASETIVLADGVYAGRQHDDQIGMENSRVGYRHPGAVAKANVAYADGHVSSLDGKSFPRALGGTNVPAEVRAENLRGSTVYADPFTALP